MRSWAIASVVSAALVFAAGDSLAQQTYKASDYTLELPSEQWRILTNAESAQQPAEFVYGDRNNGYLRIRKEILEPGLTASDLCRRDQDQKLHFQTGYVEGKEEKFSGRLSGVTFGYEYTAGGKAMAGRLYYLQADNQTVFALRFTGLRDRLAMIRNQTDSIARSFRLK
jgi:hypothetical protein